MVQDAFQKYFQKKSNILLVSIDTLAVSVKLTDDCSVYKTDYYQ